MKYKSTGIVREAPCFSCRYLIHYPDKCKAFMKGIPKDIRSGDNDHREPVTGDNGFIYKSTQFTKAELELRSKNSTAEAAALDGISVEEFEKQSQENFDKLLELFYKKKE